ncbi:unnamed protein product [Staurois parvus]|uniref:Uncharacterized protein n=1 Tax=Staurois parvus TaxID=386267 RepID=A0ABN9E047_9NEOB|nr:unnamed protein product [Staurois parvus]
MYINARQEQCRGGWPFINGLPAPSTAIRCLLCPPDTVEHRSLYGTSV